MKLVKNGKKKGFTLIELVVVIAILAILALILIPTISGYIGRANTARDEANARNLYTAAVLVAQTEDNNIGDYGNFGTEAATGTADGTYHVELDADSKQVVYVRYNGVFFNGTKFDTDSNFDD